MSDRRSGVERRLEKAAVLGAGVMGVGIAAHLAGAGVPCVLLDLKPGRLTPEEAAAGLTLDHTTVANRLALTAVEQALRSTPASFYSRRDAELITAGNFEDDLESLTDADWVIEAVVENLDVKQELYQKIVGFLSDKAILSSNTSGIPIARLSELLPGPLRPRFLGTHFFNPPRYLKLLELIPGPETSPEVMAAAAGLGERILGKGIVRAKDTPNFIANRIGVFAFYHAMKLMLDEGYTIDEVDSLTGQIIGRPRSATFRTADMVGLDTLAHVGRQSHEALADDPARELFEIPPLMEQMLLDGRLGQKAGRGFYKKVKRNGASEILMLDPESMEYVPRPAAGFPSVEMASTIDDLGERLRTLIAAEDRAGRFLWKTLGATLWYAARCVPEISDDIVNVDRALRWGFGWERGPFQVWDALGVRRTAERMTADGREPPPPVQALLESGAECFYRTEEGTRSFFDLGSRSYQPLPEPPRVVCLEARKKAGGLVEGNADASLVDLGDDVACLEFHTKMNTLGPGIVDMVFKSLEIVERDWRGLVVGNNAEHFSVGANLLLVLQELDDDNHDDVDWMVGRFQQMTQRLRYSKRPVVAAPHGRTLGGGCEVTLAANRVVAAAETYIGLVEVGAGLIPAGGGLKELVRRLDESLPDVAEADLFPFLRALVETVGMAKVATSAREGQELGYLGPQDRVVINGDHVIHEAKQTVLAMDLEGWRPPRCRTDIRVLGEPALAAVEAGLFNFMEAGYITEYDRVVAGKLAHVLCGGRLSGPARVDEQYLLDLEREAFMSLCGEERTLARMEHLLRTGKPLRN